MEQIATLILLGIISIEGVILCYCQLRKRLATREEPSETTQAATSVEILHGVPGNWRHHSWRPDGHHDVDEAERTPGLAWRDASGRLHEGMQ